MNVPVEVLKGQVKSDGVLYGMGQEIPGGLPEAVADNLARQGIVKRLFNNVPVVGKPEASPVVDSEIPEDVIPEIPKKETAAEKKARLKAEKEVEKIKVNSGNSESTENEESTDSIKINLDNDDLLGQE